MDDNSQHFSDDAPQTLTESFNSDVIKEQLKAYREDFYEEKREREKYHTRNIELERQLEEAKKTLEMQQKKVSFFSLITTLLLPYFLYE